MLASFSGDYLNRTINHDNSDMNGVTLTKKTYKKYRIHFSYRNDPNGYDWAGQRTLTVW